MENKVAWKKYSGQDLQALEQLCGEYKTFLEDRKSVGRERVC